MYGVEDIISSNKFATLCQRGRRKIELFLYRIDKSERIPVLKDVIADIERTVVRYELEERTDGRKEGRKEEGEARGAGISPVTGCNYDR